LYGQEDITYSFKENEQREVEKFVGIEVYATSHVEGIGGKFKQSFKDFIVREITNKGKVLNLRNDDYSTPLSEESKRRYTTFDVIKFNKDTFEAIREICKALGIPNNSIQYSGLKDKCSISVQRMSIKGNFIEKLNNLNFNDLQIKNVIPSKKSVKLGSHLGNNFTIIIRNIENKESLEENINHLFNFLTKNGFPNYFGLQRFGTFRPNSHIVGRYLLEGNYERTFFEFLLSTFSTESLESKQARIELEQDKNLEKAYQNFPKSLYYERKMIQYMIQNPGDYEGCISTLPIDLKNLLISSFQSYLFNKMISLRHQKGISLFEPVKGDVISILDDDNGAITRITYIYGDLYDEHLKKAINLNRASIIIPIIGSDTKINDFPLMKELYCEIMAQENINENIFNQNHIEEIEFKGSIRAMTVKPSDLRLLEISDDEFNKSKKKVKIQFSLTKGSYATMLLREIIK
jgi:tRNA pseudouridine13 synthase